MALLFWVCFGVGIGYTVIAFLLGGIFDAFDFGSDMDAGAVSPLKPAVVASFVLVFGGAGLLLMQVISPIIWAVPLAGVMALAVAYILYRFIVIPLSKAQNTSAVEVQSLIGHTAKVTEKIFQGGYGQIMYRANGNIYTSPAKAEDGGEINRNDSVEIIYIQDNTYFVRKQTV
jgi:membrane protein implicated in regulation of membrane protease activity